MNHCIAGFGDVGRGLAEVFNECKVKFVAIDKNSKLEDKFDVLHICFPYSKDFVEYVLDYAQRYRPKLTIIHSTVPPGTTSSIGKMIRVVHSPIRGRHPSMSNDIKTYTKYFGGKHAEEAADIFKGLNIKTKCFEKSEVTELGKLLSNIRWGLNISFAQEQKRMCEFYGIAYEDVVNEFEKSRNKGLKQIGRDNSIMPVMFPGNIGGHCVMPNVEILFAEFPSVFLKVIMESNEKYGKEV